MAREEHESHSAVPYVIVWALLLVLTAATYLLAKAPIGAWHMPVALTIATTKAALVVLIFMHLKDHSVANRMVFGLSLVFVVLLLGLTLSDGMTRVRWTNPPGAVGNPLEAEAE